MDTLFCLQKYEKLHFSEIFTIILVLALLSCLQSSKLHASDNFIAHNSLNFPNADIQHVTTSILDGISSDYRTKTFDEKIRQKYPKALVTDIATGIKHIKLTKYYAGKPVKINVVEVDKVLAKDLKVMPVLSSETTLNSRKKITHIAQAHNAIVAMNGTYFKPQTGVPLGTLMINGEIFTGPIYDRVALGIFDNGFDVARVQLNADITSADKKVKIDNINQPRMLSTYVLAYTSAWGKFAPSSPKYGMQLSIDKDGQIIKASANPLEIPQGGYVIVGPKSKLKQFWGIKNVQINISTIPKWENVRHIISGGPYLVKDGEVFVDITAQKLQAVGGRNPRSAIGYTSNGSLILVTVDGREGSSVGMTLKELGKFMHSIGCLNAINLDGGGSTVLYVNGKVVNKPQVKGGIPLSNAIVFCKN